MRRISDYWLKHGLSYEAQGIYTHEDKYITLPHDEQIEALQNRLGKEHYKIRNHYYCNDICDHPLVVNLMPFYKRVLCVTLQKAVEDNLSAPVTSQLSLLEELAITREIACEPLAEYSDIVEKIEKLQHLLDEHNKCLNENAESSLSSEAANATQETLLKAIETAKQIKNNTAAKAINALQTVKEFCEKAARIDALCRDKFSIHTLNSVVAQITNIISKHLHNNKLDHIAVEINDAIQNELVMPLPETSSSSGDLNNLASSLTPDMVKEDLLEMDDMIPGPDNITTEDNSNYE